MGESISIPNLEQQAVLEAYAKKYVSDLENGRKQLVDEPSNIKPFAGFDRGMFACVYSFIYDVSPKSRKAVQDRVVVPALELANKLGFRLVVPHDEDLMSHFTITNFKMAPDTSPEKMMEIISRLNSDARMREINENVLGQPVSGREFVIDSIIPAPASTLRPSPDNAQLPAQLAFFDAVRGKVGGVMQDLAPGTEPRMNYGNIIYTAGGRVGEPLTSDQGKGFYEGMTQISERLKKDPLLLRLDGIRVEGAVPGFDRMFARIGADRMGPVKNRRPL